jgi:vacuolar-type H+-ATPase subunit I/STV1
MERIVINGIEIKEIRDVQDALAAFQTMNVTAETIVEELAKQAAEYSAIIDSFDHNHSQHGEMIQALSEEQMKLQQLANVIEKMSQSTAMTAQIMLTKYQTNVQQTIEKSLSRVNIGSIDRAIESMNSGATKIDKLRATCKSKPEIVLKSA